MDKYEVPCPSCGSVEVAVSDGAESRPGTKPGDGANGPHVRRCSCRDCRHNFRHDFTFSR